MSSNPTNVEQRSYRLPTTAVPSFYDIRIEPDLKNFTFAGEETVQLEVKEPVQELMLNSADIKIHDAILSNGEGTKLFGSVEHDETSERAVIRFDGTVGSGAWELTLKFTGILNDKLKGFYRSIYKTAGGVEEVIATTKFEPCDARRAFPCWDEPAFKARFKISLVVPEEMAAISNARQLRSTPLGNGKKLVEFAPTIRMSTYLVAYVVGKLKASKPVVADGTEIRVWCVPGKEHLAEFALSAAKFSLEFFARYFQQPYPGDKLDLVAIPDFASGAMENFGCITFRETALLLDPTTAAHAELERVAEVVCHENAHMWFGDLVTMSWWNGLWLNEAFATFMATKAVDAWKKKWKFWETFNVQRATAMKTDGLVETRPIEFPVNNPEEARQMFDVLTYEKGCAILRMLELFLGEETFRHGIVNYLAKHQYDNADTADLWEAIEEVVPAFSEKVTVTQLMNTWVFQPGYPLITVGESPVTGSVTFSQQLFRYLNGGERPTTLWHVPIQVRATVSDGKGGSEVVEKTLLLSRESETFYVGEKLSSLVVNAGGHGFYRVRYSDALSQKLLRQLSVLSAPERFNFVNDQWASVLSGQSSLDDYLSILKVLTGEFGESDINVFTIVLDSLKTLRLLLPAAQQRGGELLALARELLGPAYARLGTAPRAGEEPQDAQLRGQLMSMLGELGDEPTRQLAKQLFAQWRQDKSSVDSNLLGAVVTTLAANGEPALYEQFLSLRAAAATPQEEQRFLLALTRFRQPELAARTLSACLDGSVRTQDAMLVLPEMLRNPAVCRQAWQFVKDNWSLMESKYPMQAMGRIASAVTALVAADLLADVRDFFARHYVKGGEKSTRQAIEQLAVNVQLASREGARLTARLRR
jgi:puromycin-sensitive aminopeptidase